MELSGRLAAIAAMVPPGSRLADVGTDHGFLPVYLLKTGRIAGAVASDLRPAPLEKARHNAARHGVADKISFRLCPGLEGIAPGEADVIAMAGMGGETILHILEAAPWTKEGGYRLLLQPMSSQPELRSWLWRSGYRILRETVARDNGRLYAVLEVTGGEESASPTLGELWAGRQSRAPLRGEYLAWLTGVARRALEGAQKARRDDTARELAQVIEALTQMKKEWDTWQQ